MFTILLPNFFSRNNICKTQFDTKKRKKIDILFNIVDEKTLQLLLFNLLQLVECKE